MLHAINIALLAAFSAWGLVVGLVVGFTAIGTGLLGTPGLIVLFGIEPVHAVGTMSVAGAIMMGSGAVTHYRQGNAHIPTALAFIVTAIPASFLAAARAWDIHAIIPLQVVVGIVIVVSVMILSYRYLIMRPQPRPLNVTPRQLATAPALGLVLGVLVGATSISGSLIVIAFIMVLKLPAPNAVGTTTVVTTISLLVASVAHIRGGNVEWQVLLGLVPGVFIGSITGARFVNRVPRDALRAGILVILFVAGVVVLLH